MAITVKHKFVSAIPDGADATVVRPSNWNDDHDLTGTIPVANGGTGASTLTGYVYGNGTSAMTASTTVPSTAITGLGTMSTQNANAVAVTGGTVSNATLTSDTVSNNLQFTPTTAPTYAEGDVWYDSAQHTLAYYNDATNNLVHVGQEVQIKVVNNTGSTITIGAPVYVTSTPSGQIYPNVALAKADSIATSSVLGLATQSIANGAIGYVTAYGILQPCNTGTFNVGDVLYLSPYSAGVLMNTIPPTGNAIIVGVVAYKNTPNGSIYVKQENSYIVSAGTITGTVAVNQGGTGQNSALVAGSVIYSASTTAMGKTAVGTSGQVLTSAGSGIPTWTTPTTGTVTSVDTAGTVNGLTLTGGPITTTGTVTLGGTLNLSSPPTIGNTAPNTGKFTTLEATETSSLGTASTTYVTITGDASYPMVKATGGTNTPLVLSPLGTGALQAQKTDSTATGGNARGANSTDWQTARASAGQVASGQNSVINGGQNNIVGGAYAAVGGGRSNSAGSNDTVVCGGVSNTAGGGTPVRAAIVGGNGNIANGYYNFIGGGYINAGTSFTAVTTNTTTIAVTAGTTFYLSSVNASIRVGAYITGTGVSADTYATSTVTTGTPAVMNTSTISGTTLTVGTLASGTIVAGQRLTGTGVSANTYIVSGAGSTWTVTPSQTVASTTITGIAYTFTISQAATTASGVTLSFYTPHGVVVGGGNNQATGAYSFIGGGGDAGTAAQRNTSAGDWASIVGGASNSASGNYSFVAGGQSNQVQTGATWSAIVGGSNCSIGTSSSASIAGGNACSIPTNTFNAIALGGRQNTATGSYSTVVGGNRGTSRAILGNTVFASCVFPIADTAGISQSALLVLGKQTTDATATAITSDGGAAGSTNQVILPNNSAYYFKGSVIAGVTGAGNAKAWSFEGAIERGANAASTAIIGTVILNTIAQDAGASTWVIAITADTTNGGIRVTVTGQAATTIRWVCKIETTEMTF